MDAVKVNALSKKFTISHEKEAIIRSILPSIFRPSHREELWALRDVTFDLKKGESLGVIGPNGAGKSVLLNVLAEITTPTTGDVKLSGKVSTILTLGAGFHQELTGEENIFLNAAILGMSPKEIKQKFDSIVDFCGLDGFIDAPIQTYSTGMLMRLGFSIATHVDFDVLLVDEIIGVGDIAFKEKSLDRLKEFRKQGKSIILASQEVDLIRKITDKTIYLKKGLMEQYGDSDRATRMYEESAKRKESIFLNEDSIFDAIEKRKEIHSPDKVKRGWRSKSGTKDAEILGVEFLDKDKRKCSEFKTGEPLEVKVAYRANKEILDPHFGVAIFRKDHLYCYGPNTRFDNLLIDKLTAGDSEFSIYFPHLSLSTGTYLVSVAIWEKEERYAYDHYHAFYKIDINGKNDDTLFYQPYKERTEIMRRSGRTGLEYDINIEALDKQGREKSMFKTEGHLKISAKVMYDRNASEFFIKIYTEDGLLCFTMDRRLKTCLTGKTTAKIEFDITSLNLLTGRYYISAELRDKKGHSLKCKDKVKIFSVISEKEDHGAVYMEHKWGI